MPKPQGTYLHVQRAPKTQFAAARARPSADDTARDQAFSEFWRALEKYSESQYVKKWEAMRAIAVAIDKGVGDGGNQVLGAIASQVAELRKILVIGRDLSRYEGPYKAELVVHTNALLRSSTPTMADAAALVVSLLVTLELILRVLRVGKFPQRS